MKHARTGRKQERRFFFPAPAAWIGLVAVCAVLLCSPGARAGDWDWWGLGWLGPATTNGSNAVAIPDDPVSPTPTPNPSAVQPGGRYLSPVGDCDSDGNCYIFGGRGHVSEASNTYLNDLWKFDASTELWTHLTGDLRLASHPLPSLDYYNGNWINSVPARISASGGIINDVFYIFGGRDSSASFNDLWYCDLDTGNEPYWVDANESPGERCGTYTASLHWPGARSDMGYCVKNNKLYIFGGYGIPVDHRASPSHQEGHLSDLWVYDPSGGDPDLRWTHLSGPYECTDLDNPRNIDSTDSVLGGRQKCVMWADPNANYLYVYGGWGPVSGTYTYHDDLWKCDMNSGYTWSKVSGTAGGSPDTEEDDPVYGTKFVESSSNTPGDRQLAAGWAQYENGTTYLFLAGGSTKDGNRNDIWYFNTTSQNWCWVGGTQDTNAYGVYDADADEQLRFGTRAQHAAWAGLGGVGYVFGGDGRGESPYYGKMNDLWIWWGPRSSFNDGEEQQEVGISNDGYVWVGTWSYALSDWEGDTYTGYDSTPWVSFTLPMGNWTATYIYDLYLNAYTKVLYHYRNTLGSSAP